MVSPMVFSIAVSTVLGIVSPPGDSLHGPPGDSLDGPPGDSLDGPPGDSLDGLPGDVPDGRFPVLHQNII